MAKIDGVGFRNGAFSGCKIVGVDFSKCNKFMFSFTFTDCILDYSTFYGTKLKSTKFTNCSLKEGDFEAVDLTSAVFENCDLEGAIFTDSVLERADFRSARVDQEEPVDIFWMKYAENGKKKKLNALQREFGYGLDVTAAGIDSFDLKAVAFPNRRMKLMKGEGRQFEVRMRINQQDCILQRVFIRITGGSALSPDVAYIQFYGQHLQSGKMVTEKVGLE